jgi:curved DNA-binding protein CbpA
MNNEKTRVETIKTSEEQEALQNVKPPEELRQQMIEKSETETVEFKKSCADDLVRIETRASTEGLTIDPEDKKKLQGLDKEADTAKTELVVGLALNKMPVGKQGVVIGAGGNTENWKERGWKTLDIDPTTGADFIIDANYLEKIASPASQDFLYSEYVKFDPEGWNGVASARILQQANKILKMNGEFVIKSAIFENVPNITTPEKETFLKLLKDHGFEVVTEMGEPHKYDENKSEQEITYYAKKTGEGYDPSRSEIVKEQVTGKGASKDSSIPKNEVSEADQNSEKLPQMENIKNWTGKTPYEKLGISKTATTEEIEKAFKKISKKYHPDTVHGLNDNNLSKNYEEVFKLVSDAKDELLDPQKRAEYDRKESSPNKSSEESKMGFKEAEPKEIRDFAEYVREKSRFSSFDANDIRQRIETLTRNGFDKQQVLESVQDTLCNEFLNSSKYQSLPGLQKSLEDVASIGIPKEKLQKLIEPKILNDFENFMKHNISIVGINPTMFQNEMKLYEGLGIVKEKLANYAETAVIDDLIKQWNFYEKFQTSGLAGDGREKIMGEINALGKLGFDKDKILKVLSHNGA